MRSIPASCNNNGLHRLAALQPYLPVLTLWVAVFAVSSLVARELGFARMRKYPLTILVLVVALLSFPTAGLLLATRPYHRRIKAMIFRETSAPILSAGCSFFPADNIWNRAVTDLPLDASSERYVRSMGENAPLHPDFGAASGIPYTVAAGTERETQVIFREGALESDHGPYRIPDNAVIEPASDSHVLVVNSAECMLYELFGGRRIGPQQWSAGSGAIFNLRSNSLRPRGWTSADAAGLPIVPGLVRYEEVAAGHITHALRFTVRQTRRAFVWPAAHFASQSGDPNLPPMGQRFRLRRSVDLSGFSQEARVILSALKEYGMMLSDNGGSWYISGAPDSRWPRDLSSQLSRIRGADFEAVDVSHLMVQPDSGQARP